MDNLWPWAAVAAAGALHGANPLTGWAFAACNGRPWRSLLPIAAGHVAALAAVAAAVPVALQLGIGFEPVWLQWLAAALLLGLVVRHVRGRGAPGPWTSRAGLGLWSFIAGTAHGAGWLLVPALVPLCITDLPGREIVAGGSLVLALAAVALHLVAMMAVTTVMAVGAKLALQAFGACGFFLVIPAKAGTQCARIRGLLQRASPGSPPPRG
jgi:hypothetical protein